MIADLVCTMNNLEHTHKVTTYKSVLFPAPAYRSTSYYSKTLVEDSKTYVYHGSTRATPSLSILSMHYTQRTTLRFHCVALSEQSCDSSTGQGERASVELPNETGHLQDTVGTSNGT